ncbi:type III secretion system chaperone [bacterium 19CA06SA08-2]|uniref:Type III secretion system chaperone n=1 Tax=bacterium 19CA06SA08-2 TaxID=2920658 RepID=A0AAU6U5U3_UNCXX|nr:type III secretion system chaperone [Aeromonas salmonicida]MDM5150788.1 type III secretion system chaperone [Aeromonas salmonicida]
MVISEILLAELATQLQLSSLTIDENGNCPLLIDSELPLILHLEPYALLIMAPLVLPTFSFDNAELQRRMLMAALNPAFDKEPGIGWHPEFQLIAYRRHMLDGMTGSQLAQHLGDFIEWMRKFVTSLPRSTPATATTRGIHDRV